MPKTIEPTTYLVEFAAILALPDGREKWILAKKALALYGGFGTTTTLTRNKIISGGQDAVYAIAGLMKEIPGYRVDLGYEPTDPSDRSQSPVSLEEFSVEAERIEALTTDQMIDQMDRLIAEKEWEDATDVAVGCLSVIHGGNQLVVMSYLEDLAPHSNKAKLFLGRGLLQGFHIKANIPKALGYLKEASFDDDANIAAYANLLLGHHHRDTTNDGRLAMRHFEWAGMLGFESGSEMAGLMLQAGEHGLPIDLERAARNYRTGIKLDSPICRARLAVMVLNGDVAYDESWRENFSAALEANNTIAVSLRETIEEIDRAAAGDPVILVDKFRESIAGVGEVIFEQ